MQEGFQHYTPVREPAPEAADHRRYPFMEWSMLVGAAVDVRCEGVFLRTGIVDDAMPSGDTAGVEIRAKGELGSRTLVRNG